MIFTPDVMFFIANLIFSMSLLPAIFNSKTYIPIETSLPSTIGMLFVVYGSMQLSLSATTVITLIGFLMWGILLCFRSSKK